MKITAFLILVSCFFAIGCGSEPQKNSNIDTVLDPGLTQPPPPDPNLIAGNNRRDPKNRKPREQNPAGPPPEPSEPKPAPEDSVMSAMMNEDGSITEIRTFKSHPRIDRVEATWNDPRSKSVKVFLKDGKVREAKTDRIPKLNEAASDLILGIVGVK